MPIGHRTLGSVLYGNRPSDHSDDVKGLARCVADQYLHFHEIDTKPTVLLLHLCSSYPLHLGERRQSYSGLPPSPLWSCGPWIRWGHHCALSLQCSISSMVQPHFLVSVFEFFYGRNRQPRPPHRGDHVDPRCGTHNPQGEIWVGK